VRWRNTIVGLFIFLGLLSYVYFVEVNRDVEDGQHLTEFDEQDIQSVTLVSGGEPVVLVRDEHDSKEFKIVKPVSWPADRIAARAVFSAAAGLVSVKSFDSSGLNRTDFGLEPPVTTIEVNVAKKNDLITIYLGDPNPSEEKRYVSVQGQPRIHLVNAYKVKAFNKTLLDLRLKDIVTGLGAQKINSIEISRPSQGSPVCLSRPQDGDGWRITLPFEDRADTVEVRNFLYDVIGIKAEDFVDKPAPDAESYGLDRPLITVTLRTAEGERACELSIGVSPDGKHFVSKDGEKTLFTIHATSADDLLTIGEDQLRDHRVFGFNTNSAQKVEIRYPGRSLVLLHQAVEGVWKQAVTGQTVERAGVAAFLKKLGDLKAQDFTDDVPADETPAPREETGIEILLTGPAGNEPYTVTIVPGVPEETCALVTVPDRKAHLVIPGDFVDMVQGFLTTTIPAGTATFPAGDMNDKEVHDKKVRFKPDGTSVPGPQEKSVPEKKVEPE